MAWREKAIDSQTRMAKSSGLGLDMIEIEHDEEGVVACNHATMQQQQS